MPSSSSLSTSTLRAALRGRVIAPEDADYDKARTIFLGGFDMHPSAITCPADATDVARLVTMAREAGQTLAVRSGGHSSAAHCTLDGGIVLDLRDMKSLDIDVEQRTAWAGAGLTAAEYSTKAGEHGLATGFGDTGSVGIGGITLAGGIGYLVRKHGLTIDNLVAAEIVTADGQQLHVDAESHPDLFWAIRGGGGNFGVVTRFKYKLQPVGAAVGGMLLLPATPDVITGVIAAAHAAPEELSTIANVMSAPPMPFIPAEHHGKLVVMMLMCYAGDAEAGNRAMAPFRALATPLADMVRPIKYPEMFPPEEGEYHPTAVGRTMFMETVDGQVAETILDHLGRSKAPMRVAQLRVLGGAASRVPADATAFAHRTEKIMTNVAAFYTGPDDRPKQDAWCADFAAALHQKSSGAYVAFLAEEGEARVRAAYPGATWERLAAVKARYDPTNFFRRNQNITPEVAATR